MNKLPKLPTGIQTFEKIREKGYLYVDKTKYLVDLIDNGEVYFLSRPRRFGKSLTVSTFDALFSGKKELFRGLHAGEFFERPDYRASPVVRLDMSKVAARRGIDAIFPSIMRQLKRNAERHGVGLSEGLPHDVFGELIADISQKKGPAVVLVDEYDKPILDLLDKPEESQKVRDILRDFYTQIKSEDESLRFIFMTGISKFSKMGVFSAMNNLNDISMKNEYATMLGYTEDELLVNFGDYIDKTATTMGKSREDLIAQLRDYYDGFSFDGKSRLYNPFSTLNFFDDATFKNYWFETGTPSFIARYMKDRHLTVEQFRGIDVSLNFASTPGEIENATAMNFLYQSGYLTLRPGRSLDYSLD
ncbi:MAG: AAA family ATPase, partial [Synergistaceae bacterium]|nr:AAA family ATPase [Synergistaceae bacterium]